MQPERAVTTPEVQELLRRRDIAEPPFATFNAAQSLAYLTQLRASFPVSAADDPSLDRVDIAGVTMEGTSGSLTARLYRPSHSAGRVLPIALFFHGGGWVAGKGEDYDRVCAEMSVAAGSTILSVEYRLAPEHPFPAAATDAYEALVWVNRHLSSLGALGPASLIGISAGGNLAAATSLQARDRGAPAVHAQVLLYPVLDHRMAHASHARNAIGYVTTRAQIEWFWRQYLPEPPARGQRHYASPLEADDLSRLPRTLVVAAEFDPLRDEAVEYAKRLSAAGSEAELDEALGDIHGFVSLFPDGASTRRTISRVAEFLSRD